MLNTLSKLQQISYFYIILLLLFYTTGTSTNPVQPPTFITSSPAHLQKRDLFFNTLYIQNCDSSSPVQIEKFIASVHSYSNAYHVITIYIYVRTSTDLGSPQIKASI